MGNDQTCYLLDTSVILDDPANILRICDNGQNVVVITNIVLAEMNGKKDDMRSEAGFRAREFFRLADVSRGETVALADLPAGMAHCRQTGHCDNDKYYKLTLLFDQSLYSSDILPVELYIIFREFYRVADHFSAAKGLNDAKIGEIAKDYNLTLLTNDISFKIAAQVEQIETESIRNASVERPDEIEFAHTYHYHETPEVPEGEEHRNFEQLTFIEETQSENHEIYETGRQRYAVTQNGQLEWCDFDRRFGEFFDDTLVRPINLEQKFYYTILTHPQNYVTVVAGSTGSGKTLIALQAGLELFKEGIVEGIVYARNTVTASDPQAELGFRKGDQEQKLGYFMYPLYSAVNFTIEQTRKGSIRGMTEYSGEVNTITLQGATETFIKNHNIEVYDIAHARGITISRKFVIFDEVQNASNATVKLMGTRLGKDSRIVFLGDWAQIDHPYLSRHRNGLVSLLQKAHKDDFIAAMNLRNTIRSDIARWFGENF